MPYTLAHPAVVVPFKQVFPRQFVLSALIVGSVAPDVAHGIPHDTPLGNPHAIGPVMAIGVPVALVALWVFHMLVKRPMIRLFPRDIQPSLRSFDGPCRFLPWPRFVWILVSIVIGICTHVAWDSMTHGNGWAVRQFPLLQTHVFSVAGYPMVSYFLFKHFSSMLGVMLLLFWSARWLYGAYQKEQEEIESATVRIPAFAAIVILSVAFVGAVALVILTTELGYTRTAVFVRNVSLAMGAVVLIYSSTYTLLTRDVSIKVGDEG